MQLEVTLNVAKLTFDLPCATKMTEKKKVENGSTGWVIMFFFSVQCAYIISAYIPTSSNQDDFALTPLQGQAQSTTS